MYYIGLDVHKKTISYCVKDAGGQVHREGTIGATRNELDWWLKTLPQPRMMAMEATIFTGWIYDHLLPHSAQVKVAHPVMLRAIALAKKKNDRIDAGKIADCLRCDFFTGMPHGFHGDSGPAPRFARLASVSPPDGADEEPYIRFANGNRGELREEAAVHPEIFRRGGLESPGGFGPHSTASAGEPGVDPAVPENRVRAPEIFAA
jgi:hypothetical protein